MLIQGVSVKSHIVFVAVFLLLVSAFAAGASAAAWKFAVICDSRGDDNEVNTAILGEIANAIVAEGGVELVIFPGDLITNGGVSQFQTWRDTMAPVYNAGIAVYPVRGNHDDDNDLAWINKFGADIPDNGPSGAVNYTYYVEHNNALFIGFDHYIGSYGRIPDSWLTDLLDNNTRPHIFTFGHQPAFKVDHSDCLDDDPSERNAFVADFLGAGGRVYFCGHDHFLDILRADDGDGDPDDDFIQYLVGTAGAPLRNTEPYNGSNSPYTPINIEHDKSYGYTIVEIDGNTVTMFYMRRTSADIYPLFHVMSYNVGSDIGFSGQTTIELEKHEAGQIQVDVYSQIDQTLNWTITGQGGCSWITNLAPSAGASTGPDDKTTVTIDIDVAGLAPGDYTCELLLEADNGDITIIPVALTVYDRVDLEEGALLAQYWMADCGDVDDCIAADWCVDGTIDTLDLRQLALSWLGEEAIHIHVPISYWQFDEQSGSSAADSVGENHGTLTNFPIDDSQWVDGKVDGALNFDGLDDYVEIAGYKGVMGSTPRTCAAWVKTSTTDVVVIMGWGPVGPGARWIIALDSLGHLRTEVGGGAIVGSTKITDGVWHHLAVVSDGGYVADIALYVDGNPESPNSVTDKAINTQPGADVIISSFGTPFEGLIDDVRIYDLALNSQEIAEMAQ